MALYPLPPFLIFWETVLGRSLASENTKRERERERERERDLTAENLRIYSIYCSVPIKAIEGASDPAPPAPEKEKEKREIKIPFTTSFSGGGRGRADTGGCFIKPSISPPPERRRAGSGTKIEKSGSGMKFGFGQKKVVWRFAAFFLSHFCFWWAKRTRQNPCRTRGFTYVCARSERSFFYIPPALILVSLASPSSSALDWSIN